MHNIVTFDVQIVVEMLYMDVDVTHTQSFYSRFTRLEFVVAVFGYIAIMPIESSEMII